MNTPFGNIVAATDFSLFAHRAALRAGRLARQHSATLQLLHVLNGASLKALRKQLGSAEVSDAIAAEARQQLQSLAEDVAAAGGVAGQCLVREGDVTEELLAVAAQADLLVLGPRGMNPIQDFLLGATAERIVRRVSSPLLVVRQEASVTYESVLVPVDFSDCSLQALRFARALAPEATLQVFHAYDSPFDGRLQSAGVSVEALKGYRHSVAQEAEAAMAEFLARASDVRGVRSHVALGDPRIAIGKLAAERHSDCIVIGKQGRNWLSELLLGGVARRVLEVAQCDVAIVPHR